MSDGAGEEDRVLGDECEAVPQGADIDVFEGLVVDVDGTCFGASYTEES
jgi:hypothetical protein